MNEKEEELFNIFRGMSKETQDTYLSYGRFAVLAEKAVKKQYGLDTKEPPKPAA